MPPNQGAGRLGSPEGYDHASSLASGGPHDSLSPRRLLRVSLGLHFPLLIGAAVTLLRYDPI